MIDDLTLHTGQYAVLIAGIALFAFAALHDIAARTIPNTASIGIALLGLLLRAVDGQTLPAIGLSAMVFGICTVCWLRGWMGGGDVKLLTAAALFVPPGSVMMMVGATTLFGGAIAVFYLLARTVALRVRLRARPAPGALIARVLRAEHWRLLRGAPLPYGSAIAAGTLFTLYPG